MILAMIEDQNISLFFKSQDTAEEGKWVYWLIWISGAWEPVRFDDVVTPIGLTSIHFSAAPSAGRSEDVSSRHSTCYMCVAWSSAMELSFSDVVVVRYPCKLK